MRGRKPASAMLRPACPNPGRDAAAVGLSSMLAAAATTLFVCAFLVGCATENFTTLATSMSARPETKGLARPGRQGDLSILYVTDRAPIVGPDGTLSYGSDRSRTMSFGSMGLAAADGGSSNSKTDLSIAETREIGRFPQTPYPVVSTPNGYRRSPQVVADHQRAIAALQNELRKRLDETRRKEVVVFVHGYNNSFQDAALAMGNMCNALGRDFVCVLLSWPAGGAGGILFGYNVDRESGEFAVADVKKAIRAIGGTAGVRDLHLVAHSRGSDVLASAIQSLGLEAYATRTSLSDMLKVRNIVLFAPDIDIDVASSKIFTAASDPDLPYGKKKQPNGTFPQGGLHLTVYSSSSDKALGLASTLFGSEARLGQVSLDSDAAKAAMSPQIAGLSDFVQVKGNTDFFGHGYFLSDPKVGADLVALIRDGLRPGDPGRPLEEIKRPFWRVPGG